MKKWFDISDSSGISNHIKEHIQKNGIAFHDGDPRKGGKRIPRNESDLFKELVKIAVEVAGKPYVPTEDSEQMKLVRGELYLTELNQYIERMRWNAGKEVTPEDIEAFRVLWLEKEKENIQRWKTDTPERFPEVIIELNKYDAYISNQFKQPATDAKDLTEAKSTETHLKTSIDAPEVTTTSIFIATDVRQALISALLPYINDNQSEVNLSTLILNGSEPAEPIQVHCLQVSLLYVFRQLKDGHKIPDESTAIRDWLVRNFLVKEKGKTVLRKINEGTAYSALTKDVRLIMPHEKSLIQIDIK